MSRTTSTGTTVTIEERHGNQFVMLTNPSAPEDIRTIEAGRIVYGGRGFQPAPFTAGAMTPETLRIIADIVEEQQA